MSEAKKLLDLFEANVKDFVDENDRLEAAGARCRVREFARADNDTYSKSIRYTFNDDSILTFDGDGQWDLGCADCWGWTGIHQDCCPWITENKT